MQRFSTLPELLHQSSLFTTVEGAASSFVIGVKTAIGVLLLLLLLLCLRQVFEFLFSSCQVVRVLQTYLAG